MKRYRIVSPVRFFTFIFIIMLALGMLMFTVLDHATADAADNAGSVKVTTVTVTDGDTLWNIAETYNGSNGNTRETVNEICQLNHIKASDLHPGMKISVPVDQTYDK